MASINNGNKRSDTWTHIESPIKNNNSTDSSVIFSSDINWNDIQTSLIESLPDIFTDNKLTTERIITVLEYIIANLGQTPADTLVNSITISAEGNSTTVNKGSTLTLTAIIDPSFATNKTIIWESSNTNVAAINENGINAIINGISKGTVTITATATNGDEDSTNDKSATYNITVVVPVTGISISGYSNPITVGNTLQLSATIIPSDADNANITWSSSNTNVATIDSNEGLITAISAGSTTITARTSNGTQETLTITIIEQEPEPINYYWYVGQTDPSTMTSISPIVDDTNSPGWREIGNSLPEYSSSNKLWSGGSDGTDINMGSFSTSYLALPSNTIKVYSVGTDLTNDNYTMYNEPIEIDGVNYYIYTSKSNFKYFRFDLY